MARSNYAGRSFSPIETAPTIPFRCELGHITRVPKIALNPAAKLICRECWHPLEAMEPVPVDQRLPNHRLIAAPSRPAPYRDPETGVVQCDHCVAGDHGACVGVGCYCRGNSATRAAHMACLVGRSL